MKKLHLCMDTICELFCDTLLENGHYLYFDPIELPALKDHWKLALEQLIDNKIEECDEID